MSDQEKQNLTPEETPEQQAPQAPEQKPDEPREPVHYATRSQRVFAWIAAIGVIIITLAYVYALSTGALIKA